MNQTQAVKSMKALPLLILALCPISANAQKTVVLNVNADADISLAGYPPSGLVKGPNNPGEKGGSGSLPSAIELPTDAVSLTFAITGGSLLSLSTGTCSAPCITVNFNSGNFLNDADGVGAPALNLSPHDAISGIVAPNGGFVAGVFEVGGEPTGTAPPTLDFESSGLGTSFTSLAPELNQMFFIGDGLTGDGTGTVQTFLVPAGAKLLYLGIPDACGYNGLTGCHSDNSGVFVVTCIITTN